MPVPISCLSSQQNQSAPSRYTHQISKIIVEHSVLRKAFYSAVSNLLCFQKMHRKVVCLRETIPIITCNFSVRSEKWCCLLDNLLQSTTPVKVLPIWPWWNSVPPAIWMIVSLTEPWVYLVTHFSMIPGQSPWKHLCEQIVITLYQLEFHCFYHKFGHTPHPLCSRCIHKPHPQCRKWIYTPNSPCQKCGHKPHPPCRKCGHTSHPTCRKCVHKPHPTCRKCGHTPHTSCRKVDINLTHHAGNVDIKLIHHAGSMDINLTHHAGSVDLNLTYHARSVDINLTTMWDVQT